MATAEQCFADLFRGRTDAHGLVHGESVKSPVTQTLYDHHLHEEGWSLGIYPMVEPHVAGLSGYHISHLVAWGCSDIDDGFESSLPLAINLHNVLKALGITSWVERTKGKGYHVWVFVEGWCEAVDMRRAFLFAHQVAGVTATEVNPKQETLDPGQLGNYVNLGYARDWSTSDGILESRELGLAGGTVGGRGVVPPPQAQRSEGRDRFGPGDDRSGRSGEGPPGRWGGSARSAQTSAEQEVERPVGLGRATERGSDGRDGGGVAVAGVSSPRSGGTRPVDLAWEWRSARPAGEVARQFGRVVLDVSGETTGIAGAPLTWEEFTSQAHATRNTAEQIARVAAMYVPPKPKVTHVIKRYEGGLDSLTRRLDGLAFRIFRDGPLDGRDRSGTLQRLAHLMRERSDLSPSEASAVLYDADQRWGKFHEQGRPHYLDKMIDNAY